MQVWTIFFLLEFPMILVILTKSVPDDWSCDALCLSVKRQFHLPLILSCNKSNQHHSC